MKDILDTIVSRRSIKKFKRDYSHVIKENGIYIKEKDYLK